MAWGRWTIWRSAPRVLHVRGTGEVCDYPMESGIAVAVSLVLEVNLLWAARSNPRGRAISLKSGPVATLDNNLQSLIRTDSTLYRFENTF
eukprot:scaffold23479_cov143-Cylindrotheca_fusiformis.AAC.4